MLTELEITNCDLPHKGWLLEHILNHRFLRPIWRVIAPRREAIMRIMHLDSVRTLEEDILKRMIWHALIKPETTLILYESDIWIFRREVSEDFLIVFTSGISSAARSNPGMVASNIQWVTGDPFVVRSWILKEEWHCDADYALFVVQLRRENARDYIHKKWIEKINAECADNRSSD